MNIQITWWAEADRTSQFYEWRKTIGDKNAAQGKRRKEITDRAWLDQQLILVSKSCQASSGYRPVHPLGASIQRANLIRLGAWQDLLTRVQRPAT